MKLTLVTRKIVRPNVALVPVDIMGDEELSKAKEGTEFYTECVNFVPGTMKQLRTVMWLAHMLWQNDPFDRFHGVEEARDYFMTLCRFADTRISTVTGSILVTVKSIKSLTKEEMSQLINCAMDIVSKELGVSHPELVREVMEKLGASG